METIIVEHHFEGRPFDIERYKVAQLNGGWCLKAHGVRHLRSYLSPDGRHMICVFLAPDAEAVRRVSVQLGYSYDQLWKAAIIECEAADATGRSAPQSGPSRSLTLTPSARFSPG